MRGTRRGILAAIALLGVIAGVVVLPWPTVGLLSGPFRLLARNGGQTYSREQSSAFFVVAGGGAPSYNEIALEKNVRYFQRTLAHMGWHPAIATVLFANGTDGRATVRYLDRLGHERFKVPNIDHLTGAATEKNVRQWFKDYPHTATGTEQCPTFLYFTGHGALNESNPDNNAMILWQENHLSVQELAQMLDQWPSEVPFVTMMAQCYAGSFTHLIYEGGDPTQPVALQTRCGFFATVQTRPSVGCTPLVNEADYKDYSSSFFAGLSGRDRVGRAVEATDYNLDGTISFAEAHAFAKVDGETSDWPISTSEAWLQHQASEAQIRQILQTPMQTWAAQARPEQRHVIEALTTQLGYNIQAAFSSAPTPQAKHLSQPQAVLTAYQMRLRMELITVGMEAHLRTGGDQTAIAIMEKLLACEAGSW
ncbi:MAG: Caspase domain-containing protein [Leptolyngbya sp. SIO1E4]|nr:Caspase domain-containing protein [Leptolyngbya sp. SIO1E4]